MSIAGYFSKTANTELWMRTPGRTNSSPERNPLPIHYSGAVLTGQKSVQQQQREDIFQQAFTPCSELRAILENSGVACREFRFDGR